jgi:hypothetical protein
VLDIPYGVDWEAIDREVAMKELKQRALEYKGRATNKPAFLRMLAEEYARKALAELVIPYEGEPYYRSPKSIEERTPEFVKDLLSQSKHEPKEWIAKRDQLRKTWEEMYAICKQTPNPSKRDRCFDWATATIATHRQRGHTVNIDVKELAELARKTPQCQLCGTYLAWVRESNAKGALRNSPTLDRTNNENYLTPDNTRIMCYSCNVSKRDRTPAELVIWARKILEVYA